MKFSTTSILLLLATVFFSCTYSSPVISKDTISFSNSLAERSIEYPVKTSDALAAKVMANIKANLQANVFASISTSFCEKAAASLNIHANILGGLIKVENVHVKAIESAAVKNFRATFDVQLNAKIQAHIYDQLEITLRKIFGVNSMLDEAQLLSVVVDLETQAAALINVELPKIGVELGANVKEELEIAVKGVEVNVPLILQVAVDIGINERATLGACIDAAVKLCAKLDAKASAKLILGGL